MKQRVVWGIPQGSLVPSLLYKIFIFQSTMINQWRIQERFYEAPQIDINIHTIKHLHFIYPGKWGSYALQILWLLTVSHPLARVIW